MQREIKGVEVVVEVDKSPIDEALRMADKLDKKIQELKTDMAELNSYISKMKLKVDVQS